MDQRHGHRYLSSLYLVSRMIRYSAKYRRKRWKNYLQLNLQANDVEEWCRRLLYIIYVGFSLAFEDIKIVRYEIKEGRCLCGSASLFRWDWNENEKLFKKWSFGDMPWWELSSPLPLIRKFLLLEAFEIKNKCGSGGPAFLCLCLFISLQDLRGICLFSQALVDCTGREKEILEVTLKCLWAAYCLCFPCSGFYFNDIHFPRNSWAVSLK